MFLENPVLLAIGATAAVPAYVKGARVGQLERHALFVRSPDTVPSAVIVASALFRLFGESNRIHQQRSDPE